MATFRIKILEPDPSRRGFLRAIYALVEVYSVEGGWVWRQVDQNNFPLTQPEKTFRSQDGALNNACQQLNGISVEV